MPKLIDQTTSRAVIGEQGLRELCDELNAKRDRAGIRKRYYLHRVDGKLTMSDEPRG